jgi:hypothetical protein
MYRVEKIDGKTITGKPVFICEDCLGNPRYTMDKAVHEFSPSRAIKRLKKIGLANKIADKLKAALSKK